MPFKTFFLFLFLLISTKINAQSVATTIYPKTVIFFSMVHPLFTVNKDETVRNFNGSYTIGFPVGINVLKSEKFGYSFEFTPFIKSEKGISKMNNLLFHPGVVFRFPKAFAINTRMAFETSGRYGGTLVFSKVVAKNKFNNYFIAMPVPFRFGNEKPASVGIGLQIGITIL
jgi:hypothetical protein